MTEAERVSALADLDANVPVLERREEAMISEALAAGVQLDRREDADPRAVLCVVE